MLSTVARVTRTALLATTAVLASCYYDAAVPAYGTYAGGYYPYATAYGWGYGYPYYHRYYGGYYGPRGYYVRPYAGHPAYAPPARGGGPWGYGGHGYYGGGYGFHGGGMGHHR
jgi:hypothetical protein